MSKGEMLYCENCSKSIKIEFNNEEYFEKIDEDCTLSHRIIIEQKGCEQIQIAISWVNGVLANL